jgi:hypothetical protein
VAGACGSLRSSFLLQALRSSSLAQRHRVIAAARFFITLLAMETPLHITQVFAIKDTHVWRGIAPAQLSMILF